MTLGDFQIMLISGSVVAGAMALLTFGVTRIWRNPYFAHTLWLLVLIKLVTPPLFELPLLSAPGSGASQLSMGTRTEEPAALEAPVPAQASPLEREQANTMAGRSTTPVDLTRVFSKEERSASSIPWAWMWFSFWLLGASVLLLLGTIRHRRLSNVLRDAKPVDSPIQAAAEQLAERIGLRRCPAILTSDRIGGPFVTMGSSGPIMLLPIYLMREFDAEQRNTILVHELTHIRRRDCWVNLFQFTVLVLHWWNPVAWWAGRRLRAAAEVCCDETVIRLLPNQRRSYGAALLRMVELQTEPDFTRLSFGASFGAPHITQRIRNIMKNKPSSQMTATSQVIIWLCALAILPLAITAEPERKQPDNVPSEEASSGKIQPKASVEPRSKRDEAENARESVTQRIRRLELQALKLENEEAQVRVQMEKEATLVQYRAAKRRFESMKSDAARRSFKETDIHTVKADLEFARLAMLKAATAADLFEARQELTEHSPAEASRHSAIAPATSGRNLGALKAKRQLLETDEKEAVARQERLAAKVEHTRAMFKNGVEPGEYLHDLMLALKLADLAVERARATLAELDAMHRPTNELHRELMKAKMDLQQLLTTHGESHPDVISQRRRINVLEQIIESSPDTGGGFETDTIRIEWARAKADLEVLRLKYTDDHPKVTAQKRKVEELEQLLKLNVRPE